MKIQDGVYGLPQTLELGEMKEKIYPVAVEDGEDLILVDAGLPGKLGKVEKNLEEHGFKLEDVKILVLTHQDFDHCGCAAELVEETGATVMAHEKDAPAIDGREQPIKGEDRYEAVDVDVELTGGESIGSERKLEIVNTPGHTPGHISLVAEDLLISGDALNLEELGLSGPRERFTPDMEKATEFLYRLTFLDYEKVHCFHGGTVNAGPEDVREIFENLQLQYEGYQKVSDEGRTKFLRNKLPNQEVGLSIFEIESGESHGARNDPEAGHRHSRQTEIYYFIDGEGEFRIGENTETYSEGDAFLVRPYKFRRIDADQDTEVAVAGAPVEDETETGRF